MALDTFINRGQPKPTILFPRGATCRNTGSSTLTHADQFQGGSFDAWGPTAPGYGSCREMTGPDFQSVFFRQLWASNAKLMNFYMFYG
jgi:hypothetical protein